MRRTGSSLPSLVAVCCLLFGGLAAAQDLSTSTHAETAPADLAEPVRTRMANGGPRVQADDVTLDFWWVKSLPLDQPPSEGAGSTAWAHVTEGTLVGAVRLSAAFRDIRGRRLRPGVYTLRYGRQPSDGDHTGVSPHRDFLLLSPAKADTDPAPQGHEGTIELSKQSVGISHPAVWSLDPPETTEPAPLSTHDTPAGHAAVIFEVPTEREGTASALRFGLILIGKIEA
jgi:hypothetical protein